MRENCYRELVASARRRLHDEDDDFICDMQQYTSMGSLTRHVPALTRGASPHSLALRRPMLSKERMEVMGFPYYTPPDFVFSSPLASMVRSGQLSDRDLGGLLGNSMHAAAIGAILMLVLGCTERV